MEGIPTNTAEGNEQQEGVEKALNALQEQDHRMAQDLAGRKQEEVIAAGEAMDKMFDTDEYGNIVLVGIEAINN